MTLAFSVMRLRIRGTSSAVRTALDLSKHFAFFEGSAMFTIADEVVAAPAFTRRSHSSFGTLPIKSISHNFFRDTLMRLAHRRWEKGSRPSCTLMMYSSKVLAFRQFGRSA
jgi:hypothetical protein